ncbi:MAG: diacylglycerol kinase [Patescibacteria group bacterium]|nr:diacylglycerol kinase [Patescibacteria group bacterium]
MMIFSVRKLVRSFLHAIGGFKRVFQEQNFRIQTALAIIVIFFILFFGLKVWESVALVMMITLVLVLEIINSIFERIVDILEPRVHPYAKAIKDMMAAAVLIASLGATFVGVIIFWPYFNVIFKDLFYF